MVGRETRNRRGKVRKTTYLHISPRPIEEPQRGPKKQDAAMICGGEPTADPVGLIMPPMYLALIVSAIAACYISTRECSMCPTRKVGDHLAVAAV